MFDISVLNFIINDAIEENSRIKIGLGIKGIISIPRIITLYFTSIKMSFVFLLE